MCMWVVLFSHDVWAASHRTSIRTAAQLFREGKRLAIQKQYKQALNRYYRALRLTRRAKRMTTQPRWLRKIHRIEVTLLFIIAQTYEFDRQPTRAVSFYRACLAKRPPPKMRAKAQAKLRQLLQHRHVLVTFDTVPRGALVLLQEKGAQKGRFGKTPFRMKVQTGTLRVQIRKEGFRSIEKVISIESGGTTRFVFRLVPKEAAPVLPRTKQVRIVKPPAPKPAPKWQNIAVVSGTVGASVGGAAGVIMVIIAQAEFAGVRSRIGQPLESIEQIKDQRDRGASLQVAGFVFLGVGLLAGGLAIAGAVMKPKSMDKPNGLAPAPAASRVLIASPP